MAASAPAATPARLASGGADQGQRERGAKPGLELLQHRLGRAGRAAEVPSSQARHEDRVLDVERLVEAEVGPEPGDVLLASRGGPRAPAPGRPEAARTMRKTMMETPRRVTAEARSRCARYWRKRLMAPVAPSRPPAQLAGRA